MKLSEWARNQNVDYGTAHRWFRNGTMPSSVSCEQLSTGTILVREHSKALAHNSVVIYCRVSNQSRKSELEYQVKRCEDFCLARGYSVSKVYREVASGMNDNRKMMWKMLDSLPGVIVVENKDRLTRFGFNYLERLLNKQGVKVEVINRDHEDEKDLIKDMIAVVTSFCCRLYGLRRGKSKAQQFRTQIEDVSP
jgi:putative resolvase